MSGNSDLQVYIYQKQIGGEEVPESAEKLIVNEGVVNLPNELCRDYERLQEVSLPNGFMTIDENVFRGCTNLLEINICNSVIAIGANAFKDCELLSKIEFEMSTCSSPHYKLQTIEYRAFASCNSVPRIKVPPSVTFVGREAFHQCRSLIEANLSTATHIASISVNAFAQCYSLQTVSLPNTVEQISFGAFSECFELGTVVVPVDSKSIRIGEVVFYESSRIANFVLPKGSTAGEGCFFGCDLLEQRYETTGTSPYDSQTIIAGLIRRFDDLPIHRMCYDHLGITVQELLKHIADLQDGHSWLDEFGMSPFHIFFSTIGPTMKLLEVLLNHLPHQLLKCKDANDKRPLEYLINNWTDGAKRLLQKTFQKLIIDPLARWGTTSWMEAMESKVQAILVEDEEEERTALCDEAYSALDHYENVQATSILEITLWKAKLKSGWTSDGTKRQALDREECHCLSGSHVVIPLIATFLGIQPASSEDD